MRKLKIWPSLKLNASSESLLKRLQSKAEPKRLLLSRSFSVIGYLEYYFNDTAVGFLTVPNPSPLLNRDVLCTLRNCKIQTLLVSEIGRSTAIKYFTRKKPAIETQALMSKQ